MSPLTHRTTRQRTAIAALMASLSDFRSAQSIHALLIESQPPIGLATVYRTLKSMVADGAIDTFITVDGETLYRRCSSGHHHHLVCKKCGRTSEIHADAVEAWADNVAGEQGYTDIEHTVEIVGICRDCSTGSSGQPA
ncbi:MAG: transcriptional repressor [Actinobacteria bacterium]|jgi:Fur family ferric uptake transcriptional regulator|nr:transcriptional repressor [Actinomycetota bacterium]